MDVPRYTARQIADEVAAGMDPDVELVAAQYCDAYEARIAELEAAYQRQYDAMDVLVQDLKSRDADLARVRAESLRVVPVGDAVKSEDAHAQHNFILRDGIVCVADYTTYGWVQVDGFVADIYSDTIVQPVRLERWEDEG